MKTRVLHRQPEQAWIFHCHGICRLLRGNATDDCIARYGVLFPDIKTETYLLVLGYVHRLARPGFNSIDNKLHRGLGGLVQINRISLPYLSMQHPDYNRSLHPARPYRILYQKRKAPVCLLADRFVFLPFFSAVSLDAAGCPFLFFWNNSFIFPILFLLAQ